MSAQEREMKIWFDTEFVEDGKTIDLISIGMVREDGATLYMENVECDHDRADQWVKDNVLVHLKLDGTTLASRVEMAIKIREFAGPNPEFWAYYADYDWVVLCQLYGRMIDLPDGWPMFCRDLQQDIDALKLGKPPKQEGAEHHALADALWTRDAWWWLRGQAVSPTTSEAAA